MKHSHVSFDIAAFLLIALGGALLFYRPDRSDVTGLIVIGIGCAFLSKSRTLGFLKGLLPFFRKENGD